MATLVTPMLLLRRAIDEPDETAYTDDELDERLVLAGADVNAVALTIWKEKLAASAGLVDTSEGGSQRKMSQSYDHAKAMVEFYKQLVDEAASGSGAVLRRITRV